MPEEPGEFGLFAEMKKGAHVKLARDLSATFDAIGKTAMRGLNEATFSASKFAVATGLKQSAGTIAATDRRNIGRRPSGRGHFHFL